ncbi:GAF domain-containing sensor histidine kinase [Leptolyngbya sp. AN02str]|uniref:GAF domain-containing sensor histidine kinase n=1 Tax=Leptolyngbya sp. AN02str TaxID=3423363 RepID=UPI003D31A813
MLSPESKSICQVDDTTDVGRQEQQRLKVMSELGLMDVESVPIFEEATQTAGHLLSAPICILGLMDHERQWFKSAIGLSRIGLMNDLAASRQLPRQDSFCVAVVETRKVLVINHASADDLYKKAPLVQRYGIQAYAGVPLMTSSGLCVGTLAVMDLAPRNFSFKDIELLELIARWAMSEYERNQLRRQESLDTGNPSGFDGEGTSVSVVKASLMSQMAQELRTPLTSILGMASVLTREIYGPLTGKQKEYLDIIHNSGQYLLSVLTEMLELGGLNDRNYSLNLAPIDVEMLCQQAINTLEQAASRRNQKLRLSIEPGNRIWLLDKDKIRQMLYHLVFSVIQLASTDSTIRIHVSRRQNRLNMNVSASHPWLGDGLMHLDADSGAGLNGSANLWDANQSELTDAGEGWGHEPLLRSPHTTSSEPGSHAPEADVQPASLSRQNLGLNLSRQLAEMHGGRITIQGSAESGYRYVVSIPQITEMDGEALA